jgi:hypothetical protein
MFKFALKRERAQSPSDQLLMVSLCFTTLNTVEVPCLSEMFVQHCRQKIVAAINSIFLSLSSAPGTVLSEGIALGNTNVPPNPDMR